MSFIYLLFILPIFGAEIYSNLPKLVDENSLCLTSASLHTMKTGMLSYAIVIFKRASEIEMPAFNCSSTEYSQLFHRRLSGSFCSVHYGAELMGLLL